jgi:hypothetical protein
MNDAEIVQIFIVLKLSFGEIDGTQVATERTLRNIDFVNQGAERRHLHFRVGHQSVLARDGTVY